MPFNHSKLSLVAIIFLMVSTTVQGQKANSDTSNSVRNMPIISGYGEASYTYLDRQQKASFNFNRAVVLMSYRFNKNIQLVTEFELESAGVEAGGRSGEFSIEQAYLEFKLNKNNRIVAGLFIPRIGYTNEYHLPGDHFGVARPIVETVIIPTTWREMGISLKGNFENLGGMEYQLSLMNGLNAENLEYGNGLRGASQEGRATLGNSLALQGAINGYTGPIRLQLSGYIGGSAPYEPKLADSLGLESGPFGSPVFLVEGNAMYNNGPWQIRALATMINISKAKDINKAFASNVPEELWGGYLELGYNFLHKNENRKLIGFTRFEMLDMNAKVPENGIQNDALKQNYLIAGLLYEPTSGVSIKADYTFKSTGDYNKDLLIAPFPTQNRYYTQQGIWSLGIGYSF